MNRKTVPKGCYVIREGKLWMETVPKGCYVIREGKTTSKILVSFNSLLPFSDKMKLFKGTLLGQFLDMKLTTTISKINKGVF